MQQVPDSLTDFSDLVFDMIHSMMIEQSFNVLVFLGTLH
jgi:hypothetical protein